jgi:hypothetical protein
MGWEMQGPRSHDVGQAIVPEVEFALVINRMIESIKTDPEHLRATVYELARHKLKEQFGAEPDIERLSDALEVAIRGVEAFTIDKGQETPPGSRQEAISGQGQVPRLAGPAREVNSTLMQQDKARWFIAPVRLLLVLAIILAFVFVAKQKSASIDALRNEAHRLVAVLAGQAPKETLAEAPQATASVTVAPPARLPPTPTAFGVYAISADKLYELELLPGRAPDPRVAISAAILTPSRTTLPDGHVEFVVFRRDSATNAVDHAEVRVVAKIAREISFDQAGKPVSSKSDDSWVIRNISFPYRTAPKKDQPDMYEVKGEDPETALAPGRYALVLKGQAYDFSVDGAITNPKHCLERMAASNGQFYSECPIGQPSASYLQRAEDGEGKRSKSNR